MAKVSICIPAYNNPKGIKKLLDSIFIQTYKDYEVIITDDSTTEEVKQIAEKFLNRIQYFKNEKRLGATANWNESIKYSKGDFIKIMHHDDWFDNENSLLNFVNLLEENPTAVLAFSGSRQVSQKGKRERSIRDDRAKELEKDYRTLYLGNWIGAPSAVIFRRSNKEFDTKLVWLVDVEFYINLLSENKKFAYTTKPLVSIGISETQLTTTCENNLDLKCFEFGYVFEKYNLHGNRKYQKKLIQIFLLNQLKYKELREYNISYMEYVKEVVNKYFNSKIKRLKDNYERKI